MSGILSTYEREVLEAVDVLSDRGLDGPPEVIAALMLRGYSMARSEKLYFVVELAFGRAVIEKLGLSTFPETYVVDSVDGIETDHRLAQDLLYKAALNTARSMVREGPRDVVVSVSLRSAELQAVNEMLNKGLELDRLLPPRWMSTVNASEWESFS